MLRALLLILGVGLVALAVAWRVYALGQARARVEAALAHPDAAVRARVLQEIGSKGLRPWAPLLLRRIEAGVDDDVAAELAWLVAANQWEPADDPGLVRLRLWAAAHNNGVADAGEEAELGPEPDPEPVAAAIDEPMEEPAAAPAAAAKPALVATLEQTLGAELRWLQFVPAAQLNGSGTGSPRPARW